MTVIDLPASPRTGAASGVDDGTIADGAVVLDDDVARVDADEVIRCMADPDDETLLSAAQYARDRLGLTATTPDEDLADIVARTDDHLRTALYVASDQTATAVRQLRAALAVHDQTLHTLAVTPLGPPAEDTALADATTAQIGPAPRLAPDAVRDVVQQTIANARAEAIADAITGVRAAYQAIDDAETTHRTHLAALKAALQARIEAAIATGRPVGALAGDLALTRQRLDQIRKGTR